ncbi:Zn finger protein [Clarireedia jacksonii]
MFFETNRQTFYPPSTTCDKLDYSTEKSTTMATRFAMPAQPFNTSPSQYALFNGQSQQVSPTSSNIPTPHNASPTSPRSGLPHYLPAHTHQLRPPKSPLYIPAVLRPTDPPKRLSKPSPLTPPQSMHSSFDDLENASTLTRSSTGDSGKFGLGAIKITGSPILNPPSATKQLAHDTSLTSHGGITVGDAVISSATNIPATLSPLIKMPTIIHKALKAALANTASMITNVGQSQGLVDPTAKAPKMNQELQQPRSSIAPEVERLIISLDKS